jgi:hypothetical protein
MRAFSGWSRRLLQAALPAVLAVPVGIFGVANATASAATPPAVALKVLLIGSGSSDPTTAAWESELANEGVAYTEVTASGTAPLESVVLPSLTSGTTGNFNGVIFGDSPTNFAAGQLTALDSYESAYGVRQVDGYMYPDPALGLTDVSGGALDGTTDQLTAAGLTAFPELKGPVPMDTGTYGDPASVVAGLAVTPLLEDTSHNVLAAVYQHPSTDAQAGVAELSLTFDYNSSSLQWLLLAPGLINWVTNDTHLGLYRNYFGQDIDDNFISDNEWSSTYQCTPGATEPPDYTCPAGVANNTADTPPDVQMSAADVAYVVAWEKQTGITLNMAFNGVGACSAPTAADESSAICNGSVTINGTTYTDPGEDVDTSNPNDAGLINALLADKADFNWITHTWSHQFLGCNVWQPQPLTSALANASGGQMTAGSYNYEITAATAYGESEPSLVHTATGVNGGSVSLSWPDATNGESSDGTTSGPTLAQEEAAHTGGTGFWGYYIYREDPGTTTYGLVGQVAEDPTGVATTYSFTDTGATTPGAAPGSGDSFPTATNPGIDCAPGTSSWEPATSTTDSSIAQEIGLDDAWAAANNLPNFTPSAVVTGEHSGIDNPNMPSALADVGVTTFASDASRQPQSFTLGAAVNAPRYPSNIYYNASNWPDEINEYSTLYVASQTSLGNAASPAETGHCDATSDTTCVTTLPTEASILASESHIMLGHVLDNNPRVGYAHQTDLIGPATVTSGGKTVDYGYTILDLIDSMLSQYNSWYTAPIVQMTDVSEASTLAEQAAWATAVGNNSVSATDTNGMVTVTNNGTSTVKVPVTAPTGTTVNGTAFGESYGGALSGWTSLASGASLVLSENVAPVITTTNEPSSIVGTPFSYTVYTTGEPVPALTETGALPAGMTFVDNGNGTATVAGTASAGSGGSYPISITATNSSGTATQAYTLANAEAPTITSPTTANFTTGVTGTYSVTTTGYPAPTLTELGTLPTGVTFTDNGNGTATITGAPAAGSAASYPVSISATNSSGSTSTLSLSIAVTTAIAPAITSGSTAYFTQNQSGSFAVIATGSPTAAITESGALPAGLTFIDGGTGSAILSGTPTTAGTVTLAVTASNGISPAATQILSVIVGNGPTFTSGTSTSFVAGTSGSFPITTTGNPAPAIGVTGSLPAGLTFVDNGNGTATISGTPNATDSGTYPVNLTAVNGTGSASQALTVTVDQAPVITSALSSSFISGSAGSFTFTTTGYPVAQLSESGALPAGLTFTDNGDGTATISGTANSTSDVNDTIVVTATNGTAPDATENFTIALTGSGVADPGNPSDPGNTGGTGGTSNPGNTGNTGGTGGTGSTGSTGNPGNTGGTGNSTNPGNPSNPTPVAKCSLVLTTSTLTAGKTSVPVMLKLKNPVCEGSISLTVKTVVKPAKGSKSAPRVVTTTLARGSFTSKTAATKKLNLSLTAAGRKAFTNASSKGLRVTFTATMSGEPALVRTVTVHEAKPIIIRAATHKS